MQNDDDDGDGDDIERVCIPRTEWVLRTKGRPLRSPSVGSVPDANRYGYRIICDRPTASTCSKAGKMGAASLPYG